MPYVSDRAHLNDAFYSKRQFTPSHVRAVAYLYGLDTAKIRNARVLELGCQEGAALLSFATSYPYAQAVGIELVSENYAAEQDAVILGAPENLKLYSLTFEQIITELQGKFDYITIHNSFSLLSNELMDILLTFCHSVLEPNGIVCVDWFCQPGAKATEVVRDALQIRSGLAQTKEEQLAYAKGMLTFMASGSLESHPMKIAFNNVKKYSENYSDVIFMHHFLESGNEAGYLIEFNNRIVSAGFCYVGDLLPHSELVSHYNEERLADFLDAILLADNKIMQQQYLDMATNRTQRFSLLTQSQYSNKINHNVDMERLKSLRWAGSFRRNVDSLRRVDNILVANDNSICGSQDATALGVLDILGEAWPASVDFNQLVFHTRLPDDENVNHRDKVEEALCALFEKGIERLHFVRDDKYDTPLVSDEISIPSHVLKQLNADNNCTVLLNTWSEYIEVGSSLKNFIENNDLEINNENYTYHLEMHNKGLLAASSLGWKMYHQKLLNIALISDVPYIACALLLYSSESGAGGFYTNSKNLHGDDKVLPPISAVVAHEINQLIGDGQFKKAIAKANDEINKLPPSTNGYHYLYRIYKDTNNFELAIKMLAKSLALQSTSLFIYSELAFLFYDQKMNWQAGRLARAILRCNDKCSPEWFLLGKLHKDYACYELSEFCARIAYALAPDSKLIANLLGTALCSQSRTDEGIAYLRASIKDIYNDFELISGLLFYLTHSESTSAEDIFEEHIKYGKGVEAWATRSTYTGYQPEKTMANSRKLRIGFVSGDFLKNHPVTFFISPIWQALDRTQFEIYCYNNTPIFHWGEITEQFKLRTNSWRDVCDLSDLELAEFIKNDQIDILVDLSGHTTNGRLNTFALKPAPIQISWVGYHATTGMSRMDYYATIFPVEKSASLEAQFIEKIIYLNLPRNFSPLDNSPLVNELPAMKNGYLTFGSFNRANKINDHVLCAWSNVLMAMPTSKIIIGNMPAMLWENIVKKMNENGVDAGRITFLEPMDIESYLKCHHELDILLDTFPFTGGTVTSHAAWMGLPTISLSGETLVSRQGASIMYSLGLPDFIANNEIDYVDKAVKWDGRYSELNDIRQSLRSRMKIEANQNDKIASYVGEMFKKCWEVYSLDKPVQSFSIGELSVRCDE